MGNQTRTQKSLTNSYVALIYYVAWFVLSFFSRKIFLDYLGTDILGLNTTTQNLLQFLNLSELGIASAISFSLYKPLQENDLQTTSEIVTLQGLLYKRIAFFIIFASIILLPFFPLIFKKITLPLWYAYAAFITFLYSSLLSYFINYKQVLLAASQQNYKILYSYRTCVIIKTLFQMGAVCWLSKGYMWWLLIEAVFATISALLLDKVTLSSFPNLQKIKSSYKQLREKYHIVVVKVKQLFFHKLGGFVLTQSSPLIIYAFIDLNEVALYGNYLLIMLGLQSMVSAIFNSMDAGVGNLVAEGNNFKIRNVFQELFSIRFTIAATLCFATLLFSQKFIEVWIGQEYLLPFSTLILLSINLYIQLSRFTVETFLNAFGQFSDIWAPIAEAVLNISLSILLGYFYGLNGIISGVCISQILIIIIWKPIFLMSVNMRGFIKIYVVMYLKHLIFALGIGFLFWYCFSDTITKTITGYFSLFTLAIIILALYLLLFVSIMFFISNGMRMAVARFKKLFLKFNVLNHNS